MRQSSTEDIKLGKKKTRKEDEEKDHNGNAEFPKGSIHSEKP